MVNTDHVDLSYISTFLGAVWSGYGTQIPMGKGKDLSFNFSSGIF